MIYIVRLAFSPCLAETCVVAVASVLLLDLERNTIYKIISLLWIQTILHWIRIPDPVFKITDPA